MNVYYAVVFGHLPICDYRAKNSQDKDIKYLAIFPDREKAIKLAMEMNACGTGGYKIESVEIKIKKEKK